MSLETTTINTAIILGQVGKSAYQAYATTTTDDPVLTEAQWIAKVDASKDAAANSAAAAAASAAVASSSKDAAATSATAAATSESNASTQAVNAATSATVAAASSTQAETFRDETASFKDAAEDAAENCESLSQQIANSTVGSLEQRVADIESGDLAGEISELDIQAKSLSLKSDITPTSLILYNTYTDAANYERGYIRWQSNKLKIGTEASGTGIVRDVEFSNGLTANGDVEGQGIYIDRTNEGGGVTSPFAKFGLHSWHGDSNSIQLQKSGSVNRFSFSTQTGVMGAYGAANYITFSTDGSITSSISTSLRIIQHNAANNNWGNYLELSNVGASSGVRGRVKINGDLVVYDYSTASPVEKVKLGNNGDVTITGVTNQRTESAVDPTTADYPNDRDSGTHLNTTTGKLYIAHNYSGTIYKTELTA